MIVMKFGGSSLASATAIRRAAFLVRSEAHRNPVVVVSALGKTTDQLVEILEHASYGRSYLAWVKQKELLDFHYGLAAELLSGEGADRAEEYLRRLSRELHLLVIDVAENGLEVTSQLRDQVLAMGERMSSYLAAAAFTRTGLGSTYLDAREVIVTDDNFGKAAPRQWETYAKLRATIPMKSGGPVVVLGGFIGATADGRTTTLGRGGSDFTASLIGAALQAEEIQIWTDVDGVMTCDPRLRRNVHRLTTLSYEEAAELARCGAKVLHPDTIEPARQLGIPVVVKNSLHPSTRETRIVSRTEHSSTPVKSIACATNITILEIRSLHSNQSLNECSSALANACATHRVSAELLAISGHSFFVAVNGSEDLHRLNFSLNGAVEARVRPRQAILSLVSDAILHGDSDAVAKRAADALLGLPILVLPKNSAARAVRIAVPARDLMKAIDLLHDEFFRNPDRRLFAQVASREAEEAEHQEKPVSEIHILPVQFRPRLA